LLVNIFDFPETMAENPCCLCLSQEKVVKSMFADEESDIPEKINALAGVEVRLFLISHLLRQRCQSVSFFQYNKFDIIPNGVCIDCLCKLEDAYKLRLMIINSYESLRFMYKSEHINYQPHESLPTIEMPLEVSLNVTAEELAFPSDDEEPQNQEDQIKTLIELSRLLPPTAMPAPDASTPFPCQICGRWFGNKKAVVTHVIREHTTRKAGRSRRTGNAFPPAPVPKVITFDCEVCGKPFENKSQVVTHVLQDHTATRNYQQRGSRKYHTCLRCDRKFTSQDQLLQHAINCGQCVDAPSSSDSEAS
jgi:uncharacterized C2H2 Zn-finger protein